MISKLGVKFRTLWSFETDRNLAPSQHVLIIF